MLPTHHPLSCFSHASHVVSVKKCRTTIFDSVAAAAASSREVNRHNSSKRDRHLRLQIVSFIQVFEFCESVAQLLASMRHDDDETIIYFCPSFIYFSSPIMQYGNLGMVQYLFVNQETIIMNNPQLRYSSNKFKFSSR
jgi:hypothetical protein